MGSWVCALRWVDWPALWPRLSALSARVVAWPWTISMS